MEMKIVQDIKNEVLNRREIVAEVTDKKVPSKDEVRKKLSALAEVDLKSLIIQKIDSSFGDPKMIVTANAYTDENSMKNIEKAYFLKRNFKEAKVEEAPKEEATTAPAKEESKPKAEAAPVEEKKEASVEEKKKEVVAEEPAKVEEPKAEEKKDETKKGEQ